MAEVAKNIILDESPTDISGFKREDTLTPRELSARDIVAENPLTGSLLKPLVKTSSMDAEIGVVDLLGGPVGLAAAAADVQEVTVRDAGPFEKTATYATAPLAAIPLVGKPIGKASRAVGKSIDTIFGMNKKNLTELLDEAEQAVPVDPKVKDFLDTVGAGFKEPEKLQAGDTYAFAKEAGFDSSSALFALDPLEVSHDLGVENMVAIRNIINVKGDTLRYKNPELQDSMSNLFNVDPDNYATNLESIEIAAGYMGEFISRNIIKGDEILASTDFIPSDTSIVSMAKDVVSGKILGGPIARIENKIDRAVEMGDISPDEAAEFLMHYKAVSGHAKPLFHLSQVASHRSMTRHYDNKITEAVNMRRQGINYGTMEDKEFFIKFAENSYNPYRQGAVKQPIAARMPDANVQAARKEFTGEDEPLIFLHGTEKEFDISKYKEGSYESGALHDTFGLHVGTPSQATRFKNLRSQATHLTQAMAKGKGKVLPVVLQKTRKITDAIVSISDEVGFDAVQFMTNTRYMRNGVLTEKGVDKLGGYINGSSSYFTKKNSAPVKEMLTKHGVTYIPYINRAEDIGDVSVWVLDPKFAKHPEKF